MKKLSFARKVYQSTTVFLIMAVVAWVIPAQAQEAGYPSVWTDNAGNCIKVTRKTQQLSWSELNNSFQIDDVVTYVGDIGTNQVDCKLASLTIKSGKKEVIVDRNQQSQKLGKATSPTSSGWKAFTSAIASLFFQEMKAERGGGDKGVLKCSLGALQYLVSREKIYIPSDGDGCPSSGSTQAQMSSCDKPSTSSPPLKLTGKDKWLVLDFKMTTGQCYQLNVTGWTKNIKIMAVDSLDGNFIPANVSPQNLKLETYYRRHNVVK